MMSAEHIKEKVQSIIQLPALPTVAMEIVELVDNPKTSAAKLGKLISTDQALTAKVLKIANSPFYGFPRRISTIDFAIIVLGYDALKEIVISISLISSLQKKDGSFDVKLFWDHAIASGVLARRLARDLGYRVTGEVFVGGLLHDLGISVLNRYFRSEYRRVHEILQETDLTALEAEESVLGVTHADIGGWLAERWNLPDHLVEAIHLHHQPMQAARNKNLVALIHCADVIASRMSEQPVEFDKGVDFDREALALLHLDDQDLLQEYLTTSAKPIKAEIEQVTQFDHLR